jgi:hypothetical protein
MPNIAAAKLSMAIASELAFAGFKSGILSVSSSVKMTALNVG